MSDVFKDHVAKYWVTHELGVPVERLVWRNKSGCSTYYAQFICFQGTLVVTGDLYEAMYCVYGPDADLAFFSRCDAGYLAGKLRGPNGYSHDAESWDEGKALERLREYLDEQDDVSEMIKTEFLDDAKSNLSSEDEWSRFLDLNDGDATTIFGDNWYEYIELGKIRNPQIDFQIEALRAAMKQLKDTGQAPFLDVKK